MILEWHPHFDVWALIISLVIFFEYTTDNNELKKPKRKFWYSGLFILWLFTDWPIHDIGEKYLFSVHSVEHLVLGTCFSPIASSWSTQFTEKTNINKTFYKST